MLPLKPMQHFHLFSTNILLFLSFHRIAFAIQQSLSHRKEFYSSYTDYLVFESFSPHIFRLIETGVYWSTKPGTTIDCNEITSIMATNDTYCIPENMSFAIDKHLLQKNTAIKEKSDTASGIEKEPQRGTERLRERGGNLSTGISDELYSMQTE